MRASKVTMVAHSVQFFQAVTRDSRTPAVSSLLLDETPEGHYPCPLLGHEPAMGTLCGEMASCSALWPYYWGQGLLIFELWWYLLSPQKVSVCPCSHPALMGSYRNTASGLHDKPLLVNECNAAKGSRQASCVPLEEAMAPLAGLLVADCERSTLTRCVVCCRGLLLSIAASPQ